MPTALLNFTSPFLDKPRAKRIPIILVKNFDEWLKKQNVQTKNFCAQIGFEGQLERALPLRNAKGELESVVITIAATCGVYDVSSVIASIKQSLNKSLLKTTSFYFAGETLKGAELNNAHLGWALGCYQFDIYKKGSSESPALLWSSGVDKARVKALAESIFLVRNLVNAPSNDLGPDELEDAARAVAKKFTAKINVTRDKELISKNFPLIYVVGQGSDRRPRLIDITWGNPKNPKVTLVGKGVCFDTGGLNIKPGAAMALMKKDMGGAAHALALGRLIMVLKLPVRLRILIPAVENAIGGNAFRPGDILQSRKGLTVENTNTDAEGRLILADALTYACEEKTDLIVDFATLTGSARAGLGPDIPPVFSTNDSLAEKLKSLSFKIGDLVWPMPLWRPYKKIIESPVANLLNSASVPGDLIFSALFLEQFLTGNPDWLHLDIYAWEHSGRPGRPRGGADTGLRAVLALMEDRYANNQRKSRR